jgi:surfactin synthase thioesterase subunit
MSNDRWIRRFVPSPGAASRLVCLPHAGGSASYYLPVAKTMAPKVDVLALQYPGRQDRLDEPGLTSVADLASGVFAALQPWTDKPLTIFGHSLGASVAYELTRRLVDTGVQPTALFVSGRPAPSATREDDKTYLLDDNSLAAAVKALGGATSHLLDDKDIMDMVLPSIRTDYQAAETYKWTPGPKLPCPIYALIGDADPEVTIPEAEAWSKHTTGPFTLQVFPGDHFYLDKHIPDVVTAITTHINQAVM